MQSRLGAVDAARALYTQAIALYEKVQDGVGLVYSHAELALLYSPASSDAAQHAQLAVYHAKRSQLPNVIAWVAQRLGPRQNT